MRYPRRGRAPKFRPAARRWVPSQTSAEVPTDPPVPVAPYINEVTNPSFEAPAGLTGWGTTQGYFLEAGATLGLAGSAQIGAQCAEVTTTAGYQGIVRDLGVLEAGVRHPSIFVKGAADGEVVELFAGPPNSAAVYETVALTTGWQRLVAPPYTADGVSHCYIGVYRRPEAVGTVTFYVDAAQNTPDELVDYFDGDQTAFAWEGTPHASRSLLGAIPPLPASPPVPKRRYTGFETGDLSQMDSAASLENGTLTIVDTEAHRGRRCARSYFNGHADGGFARSWFQTFDVDGVTPWGRGTEAWFGASFLIPSFDDLYFVDLIRWDNFLTYGGIDDELPGGPGDTGGVTFDVDNTLYVARSDYGGENFLPLIEGVVVPENEWFNVKVHQIFSEWTTQALTELYIDGVKVGESNLRNSRGRVINHLRFGMVNVADHPSGNDAVLFWDDAFIGDDEDVEPFNVRRYPVQTQGKCTIRLLALDGTWETVGADRVRGVHHEGLSASANRWGSDTCRFALKRQPGGAFPDLTAFTPIEIVNTYGTPIWSGRVKETPSSDGDDFSIGVEGQGWQYHLDDDVFERAYIHTRLSDWKDQRSVASCDLTTFTTVGRVEAGDGAIVIGWPTGATVDSGMHVGVTLDLGPDSTAERIVVKTDAVNANAFATFRLRGHDQPYWGVVDDAATINFASLTDGYHAGTFSSPRRYLTIFLHRSDGFSGAIGGDHLVRITEIMVFRDTAYESGNGSILKASDIVSDAATFAPLLSSDMSLIDSTSFPIPDFSMTDDRKPREAMEAANALHNWILKVRTDMRLEYRSLPTVPLFRVGAWSGADFKDASKNSGEDIYNRSIVKGTGADGGPIKVGRYASQQSDAALEQVLSPALTNPSFDTNTAGWSATVGTLTRTTAGGEFDSAPAGLKWTLGVNDRLEGELTGTFKRGTTYVIDFKMRHNAGSLEIPTEFRFGNGDDAGVGVMTIVGTSFRSGRAVWTPRADANGATIMWERANPTGASAIVYLDTFSLAVSRPTLPDRRGFVRAHVHSMSQAIIPEIGQQIADTFLATHKRTPLKGDISVKGRGGVRRYLGDSSVPPSELLIHTSELVHLSNQVDPDTGSLGRDAPIDTVTWSEDEDTASVSLDAQRDNLAALLARYDLVAGSGSS